ncbi:MAG: 4-hydroxy-tetrahydrodipicolinate reductase [Bryobacteraceae bacterium]|nr:MAG: 4-hydroxy-tetrahydrodipicolinate reductase [Bryobacteraceae bacterium]
MKLALVGYGKMGRLIEQLAPQYGFETGLILDVHNNAGGAGLTAENFRGIAAAIEFTAPDAAPGNLLKLASLGVPTVCGATGWYARLDEVKAAFEAGGAGFIYGPNFSIGVNVFERIVAAAAQLLSRQPEYEAWAWEIHHSAKKDAPSGTLLKLVEAMRKAGYEGRIDTASNRAGAVPGTHEIGFDSAADTITLRHTARSREGFARGALWAAQRLAQGLKGCHEFSQVLFGELKA